MIKKHVDDINPDLYCYDTGLTFAKDQAMNILDQVTKDGSYFRERKTYDKGLNIKEFIKLIGKEKTLELVRRRKQYEDLYPGQRPIEFRQFFLDGKLGEDLLKATPQWLKINSTEPDAMLQVSGSGEFLPTHKGEFRKCSLFMLLKSDGQETSWYRNTNDFEIIHELRIPDLDKIEKVVSVVMEPFRWYLFNHYEWHRVHKFNQGNQRISIGIDYNSIHSDQLLSLIKANS